MCNIIERSGPRQDTGEDDLEAEIIESAAIQEAISDKISQVKRILNMFTTPIPPAMLNVPAAEYLCHLHNQRGQCHYPGYHPPHYFYRQSVSRLPKLSLPKFSGNPLYNVSK